MTAAARTLALVFAHPDDETFATGGMVAHYAQAGVAVHLLCATDGDAGKTSGVAVGSREELARLRRAELHDAAALLGIRSVHALGLPDGALAQADTDALVGEIVRFLRRHRPQVVVTFGPEGAPTGHRDHRAICRAATAAFFLAGLSTAFPEQLAEEGAAPHAPQRLYYVAWPPPPATAALPMQSVPPTACLDIRRWHARKLEAFLLHRTQRMHQPHFEELALTADECYALASGVPQPRAVVHDLFDGL